MGAGNRFCFFTLARFAGEGRVRVPMFSQTRYFKGVNTFEVYFSALFAA
jgi:hypothetical protein